MRRKPQTSAKPLPTKLSRYADRFRSTYRYSILSDWQFKNQTETDSTRLQGVITRCKNVFPSEAQLDDTLKSRMKLARDQMNKLIQEQQKLGNYSGAVGTDMRFAQLISRSY